MEPVPLAQFLKTVTAWPKTQAELSTISELGTQLLGTRFMAIYAADDGAKLGFRLQGALNSSDPSIAATFEEFLKRLARQAWSSGGGASSSLRRVQVAREGVPWTQLADLREIAFVPIAAGTKVAVNGGNARGELSWIAVGSDQPLGEREEILLLAVAERLTCLARCAQYESALQLRNQFLSIASHELKTPLTSIYGILQLQERMERLKRDEPAEVIEERKANFLKIVIRQVERLNELIDGLLDVSRIQNGRFMVEPSEVDVATLLRDTISARLTVIAQEAGVNLQLEAPEHLSTWVDPVRAEEVITNLVMNAIRFSPEGGTVWIRLREEDGSFRLSVRDQGPSVPIEDRERIFQPFERAARTARLGGLGLGLFISRQIAQLHGGNVALAESVQGKGNVFEASFPIRVEHGNSGAGNPAASASA